MRRCGVADADAVREAARAAQRCAARRAPRSARLTPASPAPQVGWLVLCGADGEAAEPQRFPLFAGAATQAHTRAAPRAQLLRSLAAAPLRLVATTPHSWSMPQAPTWLAAPRRQRAPAGRSARQSGPPPMARMGPSTVRRWRGAAAARPHAARRRPSNPMQQPHAQLDYTYDYAHAEYAHTVSTHVPTRRHLSGRGYNQQRARAPGSHSRRRRLPGDRPGQHQQGGRHSCSHNVLVITMPALHSCACARAASMRSMFAQVKLRMHQSCQHAQCA